MNLEREPGFTSARNPLFVKHSIRHMPKGKQLWGCDPKAPQQADIINYCGQHGIQLIIEPNLDEAGVGSKLTNVLNSKQTPR
jgi:hypothetical protein